MALKIYVNCDTTDSVLGTGGVDWVEVDTVNDYLIFSAGSDVIIDGNVHTPSQTELNQAGTVISAIAAVTVSKYFLFDYSTGTIKEIHNAGNQNKRYVFCASFDAATSSEPTLELWDDDTLLTVAIASLGAGTAANSWWKGITTTAGLPGVNWAATGTTLAGASASHFLNLNNGSGALAVATNLYWNMAIIIPAGATSALSQPVISVKYTSN